MFHRLTVRLSSIIEYTSSSIGRMKQILIYFTIESSSVRFSLSANRYSNESMRMSRRLISCRICVSRNQQNGIGRNNVVNSDDEYFRIVVPRERCRRRLTTLFFIKIRHALTHTTRNVVHFVIRFSRPPRERFTLIFSIHDP